jgi:hypothetical protein
MAERNERLSYVAIVYYKCIFTLVFCDARVFALTLVDIVGRIF